MLKKDDLVEAILELRTSKSSEMLKTTRGSNIKKLQGKYVCWREVRCSYGKWNDSIQYESVKHRETYLGNWHVLQLEST